MNGHMDTLIECDWLIVGAGPAGLFAAVTAAEHGNRVVVAEYLPSPGRKLLASGSGKCNLTNLLAPNEMAERFPGKGTARFVRPALLAFPPEALREWFRRRGVPVRAVDGFHCFPESERARDVLDALLTAANRLGVRLLSGTPVTGIETENGRVSGAVASRLRFRTPRILIATGGNGYPALGGRGSGFELVRRTGHTIVEPVPALVGVRTSASWPTRLAGMTLERVAARTTGKPAVESEGALLFTHTGISGPAVLDLAGTLGRELLSAAETVMEVRWFPGIDPAGWLRQFSEWRTREGGRRLSSLLASRMNRRLADELAAQAGVTACRAAELPADRGDCLARLLGAYPLKIRGTDGWEKAMATSGGVARDEVRPNTLESRLVGGLYFAGETLDVDGRCGGYNLQWAFSSGRLAAEAGSRAEKS